MGYEGYVGSPVLCIGPDEEYRVVLETMVRTTVSDGRGLSVQTWTDPLNDQGVTLRPPRTHTRTTLNVLVNLNSSVGKSSTVLLTPAFSTGQTGQTTDPTYSLRS